MSDQKMGLAEYLTFIRDNIDCIYVRYEGKARRLSEIPTNEALTFIYYWWQSERVVHVVRGVQEARDVELSNFLLENGFKGEDEQ